MVEDSNGRAPAVSPEATRLARALVLYAVAEAQAGHVTRIDVLAQGHTFGVSDDGRGHSIDRKIDGTNYLSFIYSQFEFPFSKPEPGPVQLQGIGMSLLNSLCSTLEVTVTRAGQRLQLVFESGTLQSQRREPAPEVGSGNRLVGTVAAQEAPTISEGLLLMEWLTGLMPCLPNLCITLNGQPLSGSMPDL